MRKYETVFISDPDLQDQARADLFDKIRNIITSEKGVVLNFDEWGNKKLAYEIKKKSRGHYVCVTYGGSGGLVTEIERNFRLTEDVLKFMTIVLSEDTTREALEKEAQEAVERADAQTGAPEESADSADNAEEKTDTEETADQDDTANEEPRKVTQSE
jgi:small subunit ribosomal protein S6